MPEDAKHRGITYWPEFNIVLFAILLNWPWEFLQVPFSPRLLRRRAGAAVHVVGGLAQGMDQLAAANS